MNNPKILSITTVRFDEYFGFTDREVREILEYYGCEEKYELMKEWYDGYRFGNVEVYCPWDVISYCDELLDDPDAVPRDYWSNTSGNDVVKHFVEMIDSKGTKGELEALAAGEIVEKEIRVDLTYDRLYESAENIWSVLFATGYLTQRGKPDGRRFRLAIPNREIRNIFVEQIMTLFKENVAKDGETFARRPTKENFYHGILLGILGFKSGWYVKSNRESGNGYSDIMIRVEDKEIGIIIEVKYAETEHLESACQSALEQIKERNYEAELKEDGYARILKYGIACRRKKCRVMLL